MNDNPYAAPKDSETLRSRAMLPHEILLSGSMVIGDVLRAQLLILRQRWFYAALTLGLYVAFVLVLSLIPSNSMFGNTFLLIGLVVMPAILPLTLLMVFMRLHRDASRKHGIFAVTQSRFANDGIHTSMEGKEEEVTIQWSAFSSYVASPHIVLLFLTESNDHLIVARSKLVNEDDWPILVGYFASRFSDR